MPGMLLWICAESEIPSDGYQINQSSLLSDFSADIIDAPPTTLNILRQYLTRDTWMAVAQRGVIQIIKPAFLFCSEYDEGRLEVWPM